MRALRVVEYGTLDGLRVEEIDAPVAGRGEVLIDVVAAGVNFPDALLVQGTYQFFPEVPFTLGQEASGVVAGVGDGVEEFQVGDRVLAHVATGGFAERLAISAARVARIPDAMSFDDASVFGVAHTTAYFALTRRGRLNFGDTVLMTGASGGVGAAAAHIAAALGAEVIAATRDPEHSRTTLGTRIRHVVSSDPATMRDDVMGVTRGRGADVVIDVVGGDVLAQAVRCVAWEGTVVVVGFAQGSQPAIKPGHLLVKNAGVCGVQLMDYIEREPASFTRALSHLMLLAERGELPVHVAERCTLDEVGERLGAIQRGELKGRVVARVRTDAATAE